MVENIQDTDFKWFIDNYADIYTKYGTAYLAIKNKKVLGKYPSYAEAVRKTSATEQLGTFIVQLCNGNESGYTNYIMEAT